MRNFVIVVILLLSFGCSVYALADEPRKGYPATVTEQTAIGSLQHEFEVLQAKSAAIVADAKGRLGLKPADQITYDAQHNEWVIVQPPALPPGAIPDGKGGYSMAQPAAATAPVTSK